MAVWTKDNGLICICYSGSYLYGTQQPDSDIDIRGICCQPVKSLVGLTGFEQYLPSISEALKYSESSLNISSTDVTVYGINKFATLAAKANPNILELLFAKPIWKDNYYYNLILRSREYFLSNRIIHSFSGYAYSQLIRIKTHKRWLDNPPVKPDPINYGMVYIVSGGQKWIDGQRKSEYENKLKDYQSYDTWRRNRNPKRAELERKYGYDTKHAMHLYRLILEAEELLTTGFLTLPLNTSIITPLESILNGQYRYEQILAYGENAQAHLKALETRSPLNKNPNYSKIEDVVMEINIDFLLRRRVFDEQRPKKYVAKGMEIS